MKNINSTTCKYMKVNDGRIIAFDGNYPTINDLENGKIKVRYYLDTNLTSLDNEFKDNLNVVSVDLSKMNVSELTNIDNAFNGCRYVESINLGKISNEISRNNAFSNIGNESIEIIGDDETLVNDAQFIAMGIKDYKLFSLPTISTTIRSEFTDGVYKFFACTNGIEVPVILSNWDNYNAFVSTKNPSQPELVYFLNTQHCTSLGVPQESEFISKNNKNSVVDTPRLCIADNDAVKIHIPEGSDVDYFVIHASGHNGAKSEFNYVYGEEDGIYLESKEIVPASSGTSDIVVRCRDKRTDYYIFNGTIENCKKVWISIDFYKYNEKQRIPTLPEVERVNPPIPDSAYVEITNPSKISTNINALSGICLSEEKDCLYGVSDTYGLYKIKFDGTSELIVETGKDMEGICLGPNGDLFACIENEQQIIKFSKESEYKTWEVVSTVGANELLNVMKEWNNGFEGIAYNENKNVFYLGNQFKPISITEYSLKEGIKGSFELAFDNTIGGTTEIGDMQYDSKLDCMWVIDSRSSNIYKYDMEGNNLCSYKTNIGSTPNTESLFIDFENNKLYVGCDNAAGDIYIFDFEAHKTEEPDEPTVVLVTSITLDKSELALKVKGEETLIAKVLPEDATDKTITWKSSNEEVATVDENGKVIAKAKGEATITATAGDYSAECLVVVSKAEEGGEEPDEPTVVLVTSITLDKSELALKVKGEETLIATVLPEDATDKTITWESSNEEVATVDENGKVIAEAEGEATITAKAGDYSAECSVVVSKAEEGGEEPETHRSILMYTSDFTYPNIKSLEDKDTPMELHTEVEFGTTCKISNTNIWSHDYVYIFVPDEENDNVSIKGITSQNEVESPILIPDEWQKIEGYVWYFKEVSKGQYGFNIQYGNNIVNE